VPVLIVSTTDDYHKALGLGADAYAVKPVSRDWLLETLASVTAAPLSVLVIDDDETARYLVRSRLSGPRYRVSEAATGDEGLALARAERPDAIVLDLVMPGRGGTNVLEALKRDDATRRIPVVIMTSKLLEAEDYDRLAPAAAVLSKGALDDVGTILGRAAAEARSESGRA
jgi:CheY-like chemotaxis protein